MGYPDVVLISVGIAMVVSKNPKDLFVFSNLFTSHFSLNFSQKYIRVLYMVWVYYQIFCHVILANSSFRKVDLHKQIIRTVSCLSRSTNIIIRSSYCMSANCTVVSFQTTEPRLPSRESRVNIF